MKMVIFFFKGIYHGDLECAALKTSGLKVVNLINNPQIVMPLRCFILKLYAPDVWRQFISMESHSIKRKDTPIWQRHKELIEEVNS